MNVLILQGGDSPEREVSLRSAEYVVNAACDAGHNVETYDTKLEPEGMKPLLARADIVFPVLHGTGGEDGVVQQALEDYGAAFVGTGAKASARCFDKIASKQAFADANLPTPRWEEVNSESFQTSDLAKKPYVLKPRASGSSVDTFIVRDPANPSVDLEVFQRYETMLLEELIAGTELTVGVLGDEALPVVEIIPPENGEFDFENKYNGQTQELCPPENIDEEVQKKAQELALQTHRALGARHFSRTDLMLSPDGKLYILEINTIPGLTAQSLFPKEAAAAGMSMPELLDRLINFASNSD